MKINLPKRRDAAEHHKSQSSPPTLQSLFHSTHFKCISRRGGWSRKRSRSRISSDLLSILISHKTKGSPESQTGAKKNRSHTLKGERASRRCEAGRASLLKFYQVHIKLKKPWWCRAWQERKGGGGEEVAVTSAACNYCKTLTISVTSRWASAKWQINKNKLNSNSIIKKIYTHTYSYIWWHVWVRWGQQQHN